MLTRLKVSGFKNLVDVDVRFGAFTCIAGANGVGKSNLFDAIRFLSALAQMPLMEAALSIRDGSGKASDVRNLFHRVGDRYVDKMSFEAEMIIPSEGISNFGQNIKSTSNFIRYFLEITYKKGNSLHGKLEIINEELIQLDLNQRNQNIFLSQLNEKKDKSQLDNHIQDAPKDNKFITTEEKNGIKYTKFYLEKNTYRLIPIQNLDRTTLLFMEVLSHGTTYMTYQEITSWQLLQIEPSALRKSNEFIASTKLDTKGSNLAANLYHLIEKYYQQDVPNAKYNAKEIEAKVHAQASNRLSELIDDVDEVWVDRDDKRELLTLMVKDKQGTVYPARSLSDGTLRFLALTALELDPESFRLLCLEEPENGIHPDRIPKILELLQDMAVDFEEPIDFENPLRQVIINTHSPVVVQQVPEDSLLIADTEETLVDGQRFKKACFRYLADTWRDKDANSEKDRIISKGEMLSYLNPVPRQSEENRVVDRPDIQSLMPDCN